MRCLHCNGIGFVFSRIPTDMYKCGFYDTAKLCPTCRGEKTVPNPVPQPCAAAGEKADTP